MTKQSFVDFVIEQITDGNFRGNPWHWFITDGYITDAFGDSDKKFFLTLRKTLWIWKRASLTRYRHGDHISIDLTKEDIEKLWLLNDIVKEHIERRRKDYEVYILEQKEKARWI